MRNFFNLPQAGFGAKGKRWSPRTGVSTGRITRSRRSDNTETPNALSFRNADAGLLAAPIRLIAARGFRVEKVMAVYPAATPLSNSFRPVCLRIDSRYPEAPKARKRPRDLSPEVRTVR